MQLTHFDRWLRQKFVYQTHIHTLRPPATLPTGIRALPQSAQAVNRYKFHFVATSSRSADALIRQLKADGQMYTTRVINRNAWFVPLLAPKDKSVSWWLFSMVLILGVVAYCLLGLKSLVEDPVFRKNFMDSLRVIKG